MGISGLLQKITALPLAAKVISLIAAAVVLGTATAAIMLSGGGNNEPTDSGGVLPSEYTSELTALAHTSEATAVSSVPESSAAVSSVLNSSVTPSRSAVQSSSTAAPTKAAVKPTAAPTVAPKASATAAPEQTEPAFMKDIGKTLAVLRKEHPKGVYSFAGEINAMAECFGENSAKYSYYFLSRQSPPSLEEMAVKYGDKLKCAGFVTTVGVLFPQTTDGMTLEDFFAKLNVSEYEYGTYGPVTGWITFNYNGRSVKLGTFESEDRYTNYKPTTKMKSSYPVIICEDSLVSANQKIHSGS